MEMTWLLTWRNVSVTTLNAMLQRGIKLIKSGLYGGDKAGIYYIDLLLI